MRRFKESDRADLYEFLAQLENDEFEGYPGITYENSVKHLSERLDSDEYYAVELKETGKVIGNIYCENGILRRKRSATSSIRTSGTADTRRKRCPPSLKTRFYRACTAFTPSATREANALGGFWKEPDLPAKRT